MTGDKAILLLKHGYKLRREAWKKPLHIFYRNCSGYKYIFAQGEDIFDVMDDEIKLSDFLHDDWEIYIPSLHKQQNTDV